MKRKNLKLLDNKIENNLSIQLQEYSEEKEISKKSPEKDSNKSKQLKQQFEHLKEEIKSPKEENDNSNKTNINSVTFSDKSINNNNNKNYNSNETIHEFLPTFNDNYNYNTENTKRNLDDNFYFNHNEGNSTKINANEEQKDADAPGFFKRATILLKNAINNLHEEETAGFDLKNKQDKKFIIKHIKSFQKFCVQEEINGDEISNFYFMQFLEIFLLHIGFFIFGIFIVPLYRFIYGPELIRNLGFWGKRLIRSRNAQYSYWIFFMITLGFSFAINNANEKGNEFNIPDEKFYKQEITLSISYCSVLLVFIRYLIVSIKYGFFPKKYYNDIKKKNLYKSNIKSNFLKFGWIKPDFSIINIYLKSAFKSNNSNYKSFYLECVGQIKENLITKITDIENEIQIGNNKKRESYTRKIKKEKVSAIKFVKTNSQILNNSSIIEEKRTNKDLDFCLEENMNKNLKILECLKSNSIKNNNKETLDKIERINSEKDHKPNLDHLSDEYLEDNIQSDTDFKMRFFLNSFEEEKCKNDLFEDILKERNLNKNSETDDNKSKVSCESSDSSVGNLSFLEASNNKSKTKKSKNLYFKNNFNNLKNDLNTEQATESKLSPALQKLKNFVYTTLFDHIKKQKRLEQKKKASMQGKIEYVNKNVYKINGLYLSKMIMKKINNSITLQNYKMIHIFLVILLLIIPAVFISKIFLLAESKTEIQFSELNEGKDPIINPATFPMFNYSAPMFNMSDINFSDSFSIKSSDPIFNPNFNASSINETNWDEDFLTPKNRADADNYIIDLALLKFNIVSVILITFSVVSSIIPVWVNTQNLVYGLIDFARRRKIMEILYDIINPKNKDINYDLPILNITSQETLLNWYHLRNIMMRYGKRFTDRIMIQTSVYGLYLILSLIAMIMIYIGNFGSLSFIVINEFFKFLF